MTAPASPLPPEVIALLGNDATPERAEQIISGWSTAYSRSERYGDRRDAEVALSCWSNALAAAAVRLIETERTYLDALREHAATQLLTECRKAAVDAIAAYDALRNWRKP